MTGPSAKTKEGGQYAVLVGDILSSTLFPDQKALFTGLQQQFKWVNEHVKAVQALRFTVGDEFQAAYEDLVSAFTATILLRLKFKAAKLNHDEKAEFFGAQEVRIGLAYGRISVYDEREEPYGQSGEAWWSARKAIEQAEEPKSRRYVPYSTRTRYYGSDPHLTTMTNSFWLALDQVLYRMDKTDTEITLETLTGRKQKDIAQLLGLSQPVISRRSKRNGVFTILKILDELAQIPS
jgi:hypothetical protein